MDMWEVVLHTHVGHRYVVEAVSPDEAYETAKRGFVEEGDDGEVLYDAIDSNDVKMIPKDGGA